VRSLKTHTLLEEEDKFLVEPILFIVLDQILKVIWENDNFHCAHVSSSKLLCSDANEAHLFPDARNVGLLGSLERCLILLKFNKYLSQLLVVSDLAV
jgi:hypothetical protein